jgi:hypothetical protein
MRLFDPDDLARDTRAVRGMSPFDPDDFPRAILEP